MIIVLPMVACIYKLLKSSVNKYIKRYIKLILLLEDNQVSYIEDK